MGVERPVGADRLEGDLIRQQYRNIILVDTDTGKPKAGSAPPPNQNFNNFGGMYQHPDWITGLAFSADGQTIITASRDFNIRFWSAKTGQVTRQFRAHNADIAQLVVAPEDGMIATAGEGQGSGGMFGMGGIMGAANRLMSAGLSMGQVQSVTREIVAYAREKAGEALAHRDVSP